jgi:hypothetical protein
MVRGASLFHPLDSGSSMNSRTRYIVGETLISIAINVALSIAFVFLAFHGQFQIGLFGRHGIVIDMVPQTFMVALMAFLVPALITRRRLADGALIWIRSAARRPRFNAFIWAIAVAIIGTCLVVGISWLVLPKLCPAGVTFRSLLLAKAVFGGALAAAVTPWAIKRALHDC